MSNMQLVFLDYESFWDTDHSLSKMSPIEYVMSQKTEIQACAVKFDNAPTDVIFGEDQLRHTWSKIDWSNKIVIGHNLSMFDAMIHAWRFGIKPAMWLCTMAMARPLHAKTVGLGLGKLAAHYGLGVKNNAVLVQTKGRYLADFTPAELAAMEVYNKEDTELCAKLFHVLKPHYSAAELFHLDCNIRMLVEPKFELDAGLLKTALSVERSNKHKALLDLAKLLGVSFAACEADPSPEIDMGVDTDDIGVEPDPVVVHLDEERIAEHIRAQMASAPRFAALLESRGVPVPMKPSPTNPATQVPALAKTDEAFVALQEHEDEIVATAARTRLAVKSTLLETRIEAFLAAGEARGGYLPIPLNYAGADTTGRDSGQWYNPQNMPRIVEGRPRVADALRNSLRAPKGYVIGVADQSGIELRVNHFLWQVPSSMKLYRESPDKADLYRAFASSDLYHCPPEQISKPQRQIGKIAQLGLGFGAGPGTFQRIARNMGGIDMPLVPREDHPGEMSATAVVQSWRLAYPEIVGGWKTCGESLSSVCQSVNQAVDPWGLVTTCEGGLRLPSGRLIRYPGLRYVDDGQTWPDGRSKKSWVYAEGRHKTYLTGPKVTENIVQALARDSVFDCALQFFRLTKLRPVLRVHDELVYVFPQSEGQALLAELQAILRTPPKWWPELVVWSEGDVAATYGEAK